MKTWTPFLIVLALLTAAFLPTLQTIPNGSSHYFMIDVGETQIVLNNWGTLHATGYPLYVITGNLLTEVMNALGLSPIVTPALVSWFWGILLLATLYWLMRLFSGGKAWLAALVVMAYALTRTIWVHFIIAEIYTFGLLIQVIILALAFRHRAATPSQSQPSLSTIYWMAFLGGLSIAHHRATIVMIPPLLYAVWPTFITHRRQLPKIVGISLLLGLVGFTQYAYMYLRAQAGADWVYGEPDTLSGLWIEFIGREAERFIGLPDSFALFIENVQEVNAVLLTDLTLPAMIAGIIGLMIALRDATLRCPAITLSLLSICAYLFHIALYRDILSALILLITLPFAFGWLFFLMGLLRLRATTRTAQFAPYALGLILCGVFVMQNFDFLRGLTHDDAGLQTIEQLRQAPEGSTVMMAWGPLYFAGAIAQELQDDLTHIQLVDHKADFRAVEGALLTPEYTLYRQNVDWWQERLGWDDVFIEAVSPRLVSLSPAPTLADESIATLTPIEATIHCNDNGLVFSVLWQMGDEPMQENLSIFVHALDETNAIIGQGDQSAPVYGWRPFTGWLADEQVRDVYPIPITEAAQAVRFGLYRITPEGEFENVSVYDEIPVDC